MDGRYSILEANEKEVFFQMGESVSVSRERSRQDQVGRWENRWVNNPKAGGTGNFFCIGREHDLLQVVTKAFKICSC